MNTKKRPFYAKAYEAWSTLFVVEIITIPMTKVLGDLKVHPNAITMLSMLAGFVTVFFFATGSWVWGAVTFQLSNLFDCMDGKVARYRGMASKFGAKLDVLADAVKKPASFMGIAIYFYRNDEFIFAVLVVLTLFVQYGIHKLYIFAKVSEYDLEFPDFHRKYIRRIAPRMLNLYTFFEEQFLLFTFFPVIGGLITLPKGRIWFFYGAITVILFGILKLFNSLNYRRKGMYDKIYQNWVETKGNLDQA